MADDLSLDENQMDISVEVSTELDFDMADSAVVSSVDVVNDGNQVSEDDLDNEGQFTELAVEQSSEEINELKKNLSKDLKIID
jgi:hypothetical protein